MRRFLVLLVVVWTTPVVSCETTPSRACLLDRFEIAAEWVDYWGNPATIAEHASAGKAAAVPLDANTVGFWFFDPDNLDLVVRLLPECDGGDDAVSVEVVGLVNVGIDLAVEDTVAGVTRAYRNALGQPFQPLRDPDAFRVSCSDLPEAGPAADMPDLRCADGADGLCLLDGRFAVDLSPAAVTPLTDGSISADLDADGLDDLWLSVLDGRAQNLNYWIAYELLDPGEFTLEVVDRVTADAHTLVHRADHPLLIIDPSGFRGDVPMRVDGGFSGSWYGVGRSGEGVAVEITRNEGAPAAVLYFFSYTDDGSGRQAWMTGAARLLGDRVALPLVMTSGATFGSDFDADSVQRREWGHAKFTFDNCNQGRLEVTSPVFSDVSFPLRRLEPSPAEVGRACAPHYDRPEGPNGALAGSWMSPERSGEGFFFNVFDSGGGPNLIAYYFTYAADGSGDQAWLVGAAPLEDGRAVLPMTLTQGARYGEFFDPDDVERIPWGSIEVEFQDCVRADVSVESELFGNVDFPLERMTGSLIGASSDCGL
ncbi:MAG: hypothetical protein R3200_09520 [Xanthomonadales bacterium]|nr:hypothetical protein [Xanthomonadales bacterium]